MRTRIDGLTPRRAPYLENADNRLSLELSIKLWETR